MLQQILAALGWVVSAAVVAGLAGAIIGEVLKFVSRRVADTRLGWLFGDLGFGEAFGLGLLIATFVVAGAYSAISGGAVPYGSAWFRYAIGAGVAFAAYGVVASRRSA
jgi:hypothetical protein